MTNVLINENSRRIDEDDMTALLAGLEELGYSADVDPSTRVEAGHATDRWTLVLRWVGRVASMLRCSTSSTERRSTSPTREGAALAHQGLGAVRPLRPRTTVEDDDDDVEPA